MKKKQEKEKEEKEEKEEKINRKPVASKSSQ